SSPSRSRPSAGGAGSFGRAISVTRGAKASLAMPPVRASTSAHPIEEKKESWAAIYHRRVLQCVLLCSRSVIRVTWRNVGDPSARKSSQMCDTFRCEAPWHTPDGPFGAPSDRQRPPLLLHLQCGESRSEGMYAMCTLS